jgi:hypothetical protein
MEDDMQRHPASQCEMVVHHVAGRAFIAGLGQHQPVFPAAQLGDRDVDVVVGILRVDALAQQCIAAATEIERVDLSAIQLEIDAGAFSRCPGNYEGRGTCGDLGFHFWRKATCAISGVHSTIRNAATHCIPKSSHPIR